MQGDEGRALAAGCDGYVAKPIDVKSLAQMVRRHLGGAREET
jgi:CheY-like chemotaxis protein